MTTAEAEPGMTRSDVLWIRMALFLCLFGLFAGCGGDRNISRSSSGKTVVLDVGASTSVDGGALTVGFVEVLEDSRCPDDATCVWAGNGRILLELTVPGGSAVSAELNSNTEPTTIVFSDYEIEFGSLSPEPLSTRQIPPGDYEVALEIRPLLPR